MFVAWIIYKSSPAALMLNMKSMLKLFWQFLCSIIDACRSQRGTLDQPVRVVFNQSFQKFPALDQPARVVFNQGSDKFPNTWFGFREKENVWLHCIITFDKIENMYLLICSVSIAHKYALLLDSRSFGKDRIVKSAKLPCSLFINYTHEQIGPN